MKRILSVVLCLMICLSVFMISPVSAASGEISVYLNDKAVNFDVAPIIENDRTLTPMRAIFEAYGMNVTWDDSTKTVTATKDGTEIKMTVGDGFFYKNNVSYSLDVPAKIINGRTLIPLRAVSEALDCSVDWDSVARRVIIKNDTISGVTYTMKSETVDEVYDGEGRLLIGLYHNYPQIEKSDAISDNVIKLVNDKLAGTENYEYDSGKREIFKEVDVHGYDIFPYSVTLNDTVMVCPAKNAVSFVRYEDSYVFRSESFCTANVYGATTGEELSLPQILGKSEEETAEICKDILIKYTDMYTDEVAKEHAIKYMEALTYEAIESGEIEFYLSGDMLYLSVSRLMFSVVGLVTYPIGIAVPLVEIQ